MNEEAIQKAIDLLLDFVADEHSNEQLFFKTHEVIDDLRNIKEIIKNEKKATIGWGNVDSTFDTWWNRGYDGKANPFAVDSYAYWAWAGWTAAKKDQTAD